MTTISKAAFTANTGQYLEQVEKSGEEILVIDHDVAVVKIVPVESKGRAREVLADVRGKVKYHADLLEPTTDEWNEV